MDSLIARVSHVKSSSITCYPGARLSIPFLKECVDASSERSLRGGRFLPFPVRNTLRWNSPRCHTLRRTVALQTSILVKHDGNLVTILLPTASITGCI